MYVSEVLVSQSNVRKFNHFYFYLSFLLLLLSQVFTGWLVGRRAR